MRDAVLRTRPESVARVVVVTATTTASAERFDPERSVGGSSAGDPEWDVPASCVGRDREQSNPHGSRGRQLDPSARVLPAQVEVAPCTACCCFEDGEVPERAGLGDGDTHGVAASAVRTDFQLVGELHQSTRGRDECPSEGGEDRGASVPFEERGTEVVLERSDSSTGD